MKESIFKKKRRSLRKKIKLIENKKSEKKVNKRKWNKNRKK